MLPIYNIIPVLGKRQVREYDFCGEKNRLLGIMRSDTQCSRSIIQ